MASTHRYTVDEIRQMRKLLDDAHPTYMNFFGGQIGPGPAGIEQMLRTYMTNGTTVAELERVLHPKNEKAEKRNKK